MLERKAGIQGRPTRPPEALHYVCRDCNLPCFINILTPAHMHDIPPTRCIFHHNHLNANWQLTEPSMLLTFLKEEHT